MTGDLQEKLDALREEVNRSQFSEESDRDHIRQLIEAIDRSGHEAGEGHEPVIDNIKISIERFETEHPRATAILNEIMVTLSNMGI